MKKIFKVALCSMAIGLSACVFSACSLFAKKQYVVTYQVNGGTAIESQTYKWSETPVKPTDPVNGNLYFFGWYLDEEFENKYEFNESLKVNTTLYAYFSDAKPIYTADDLAAIVNVYEREI